MNNITHKKYTLEEIIEDLSQEKRTINLLSGLKIRNIESTKVIQEYWKDDDRGGIIVNVNLSNETVPKRIMIDLKVGQPCNEQVVDAVYGEGDKCDTRIIMFTGGFAGSNKDDPAADESVVEGLVNEMNQYPFELYLVELIDRDSNTGEFRFKVIAKPEFPNNWDSSFLIYGP